MTISDLYLISPLFIAGYLVWVHGNIGLMAKAVARKRCDQLGVQLLDQTVTLERISIQHSKQLLFVICRQYAFEFSTVGDRRYKGSIQMLGRRVANVELAPFKEFVGSER